MIILVQPAETAGVIRMRRTDQEPLPAGTNHLAACSTGKRVTSFEGTLSPAGACVLQVEFMETMPEPSPDELVDVLIIGGGPAGLAAAAACVGLGARFALIERGLPAIDRRHDDATHLGEGIGGCGLYSDGKFSFRPSATRLWELPNRQALAAAERWVHSELNAIGHHSPVEPVDRVPEARRTDAPWREKIYPSTYLTLHQRVRLVRGLTALIGDSVTTGTELVGLDANENTVIARYRLRADAHPYERQISAKAAILAVGRLGLACNPELLDQSRLRFRRVEVGVRIETNAMESLLNDFKALDVKLIGEHKGLEWRTFCSCRNGEAVSIPYGSLFAYSGRSDCPPTGRSNFGINIRITDENSARVAWNHILSGQRSAQSVSLRVVDLMDVRSDARAQLERHLAPFVVDALLSAMTSLTRRYPALLAPDAIVLAPCIEGSGWYPDIDDSLQLRGIPVWAPGDISGIFRGNVAALVSGYYAGLLAAESIST